MGFENLSSLTFGPVPSRRLGRSLGINNIFPKTCSYACIYCQLGDTLKVQIERQPFYPVEDIVSSVKERVNLAKEKGEGIDYLAYVPDGEPTFDIHLGKEIGALKPLGIKLAVISNASLIDRPDVRGDLARADWVSLKVDTLTKKTWHKINRPNRRLNFSDIQNGALQFRNEFKGILATETMLVKDINDSAEELEATALWLHALNPDICYISVPIRPPAKTYVDLPAHDIIIKAYHIFKGKGIHTELLIDYEGDDFVYTDDTQKDLLSIMSVHPMRKDAIERFLEKSGDSWERVEALVREGKLRKTRYHGQTYYARILKRPEKIGQ